MKAKIDKQLDMAEEKAEKDADDLIGRIKEDGIDMQRSHLIELHRVAIVRDIFLDHPVFWLWQHIKLKIGALKIRLKLALINKVENKLWKLRREIWNLYDE